MTSEESEIVSELYEAFKLRYVNDSMTKEQQDELRRLHESRGAWGITLSQADNWMKQAGLVKKKVLSIHETGVIFAKFKSFQISEQDFLKYLQMIAEAKKFNINEIKSKLSSAVSRIE